MLVSPVINAGMVSGAAPALAPALSWIGKAALKAGAGYVAEEHLDYREENKNYVVILESGVYDGIEFSEPHYMMVGDEMILLGNNPDYDWDRDNNNAIRDKLTHSLVSMNLNNSVAHDVKVNSDHCRINSEMSKYFDSANYSVYPNFDYTSSTIYHGSSVAYGTGERTGFDQIYGGFLSYRDESSSGVLIYCPLGASKPYFNGHELHIQQTQFDTNHYYCNHIKSGIGFNRSGMIQSYCTEDTSVIIQETNRVRSEKSLHSHLENIQYYPEVGRLASCVATDGYNDYVVGGVTLRGKMVSSIDMYNRSTGEFTSFHNSSLIRGFGSSCYVHNETLFVSGGFDECPTYEYLQTEFEEPEGKLGLVERVFGPTPGGGCLGYVTEGFESDSPTINKPPSLEFPPTHAFPLGANSGFECASEFTLNLETKQVAVVNEYTNQRCTAFATDYIQDGILYRFGGFTPLGETSDQVSVSYQNNTSGEFESRISFSMYIPRIKPILKVSDDQLEIYGGSSFSHASGHMYSHIETFSSDKIDVVRLMNPLEEENSPFYGGFIILLSFAVSAVYLERKRMSRISLPSQDLFMCNLI